MAKIGKVHLVLSATIAVAMAGALFLRFGEANLSHLTGASGVLTMNECLECHSSSSTRPVSICLDDHCIFTKNHSLMHSYPPRGKETEYASVPEVTQAGVTFEDGKITCLSCHDLTKPAPHLIREGDKLCFICHRELRP